MKTTLFQEGESLHSGVERFTSARGRELVAEVGEKYLSRQPRVKPQGRCRGKRVARRGRSSLGQEGLARGERRGCETKSARTIKGARTRFHSDENPRLDPMKAFWVLMFGAPKQGTSRWILVWWNVEMGFERSLTRQRKQKDWTSCRSASERQRTSEMVSFW